MRLSEKFARQEDEGTRQARITRKRVSDDRAAAVRRMLGLPDEPDPPKPAPGDPGAAELACPQCGRRFKLAMHLGRHLRAAHPG